MDGVHIGTAGWALPAPSLDLFPPAAGGSNLARYAARFDAVEINSSFYRPHRPQTYARWAAEVPPHFRFAVKLPKSVTHEKRLQDCEAELDSFAAEAGALGDKLGWVLVQLPPSLVLEPVPAAAMFAGLRARFGAAVRLACEARHGSWFGGEATALLRSTGVTRVIADPPAGQPGPYVATTGPAYIRLHGSPLIYRSVYEPERLAQVAGWLRAHPPQANGALVIFDNTMSSQQARQAQDLRILLGA